MSDRTPSVKLLLSLLKIVLLTPPPLCLERGESLLGHKADESHSRDDRHGVIRYKSVRTIDTDARAQLHPRQNDDTSQVISQCWNSSWGVAQTA